MSSERKRKTKDPCPVCGLHRQRCICEMIPSLDLKTKVVLVVHHRELKRTTNTGRLAIQSLRNSEMRIRGNERTSLDLSDLLTTNYHSVLFFPSEDAIELTESFVQSSPLPLQLIVPDGNWRQASKVYSRHPELKNIPKVKISAANKSEYHLRKEHSTEGMATLQAIAYALGIIEGPTAMDPLLLLYQAKLQKTLQGRGQRI